MSTIYHLNYKKKWAYLVDLCISGTCALGLIYLAITKQVLVLPEAYICTALYTVFLLYASNLPQNKYEIYHPFVHLFGGLLGVYLIPGV